MDIVQNQIITPKVDLPITKDITLPVVLKNNNLNLEIKDFYFVEDKICLSLKFSQYQIDNFSLSVMDNKLILTVAIEKRYQLSKLTRELIKGDPLKTHASYYIMSKAEIIIPGEKFSLLRTFNFPDDKEIQVLLSLDT